MKTTRYMTVLLTASLLCSALISCGAPATPDVTSATATTTSGTTASEGQSATSYTPPETSAIICGPEVLMSDDFNYSTLSLPDYKAENPVRYQKQDETFGGYDGRQDFGRSGEICTVPTPQRSTYTYQMYSWFIRNDITHLYPNTTLPSDPIAMAEWLAEYWEDGRNALWYSMMDEKPHRVELTGTEALTAEGGTAFCRARYSVSDREDKTSDWALYILCEEGTASVLGIRISEAPETVIGLTDTIIRSYQSRTN